MASESTIKAIVFDCFGVLTTEGWLPFKQKYFGHDAQLLQQATDLRKTVDSGLLGYDEFTQDIARLAGIPELTVRQHIDRNVPNEELFLFIQTELKSHYKIGMLSNAGGNWLQSMFSPEQLAVFDACALSYELGVTKPEPGAYEAIANLLHVAPAECLMIDDQERHCTGAREAGMQAILYKDTEQCKKAMRNILLHQTNKSDF